MAATPEVLDVRSGGLTLRAQLWRPSGSGPFPAVLFNHGSHSTDDPLPPWEPETLGPVFARHGYVLLWLHRPGTGLSSAQGISDGDQMARALKVEGVDGRNRVQLQLLENEQMNAGSALAAEMQRLGKPHALKIYPPLGPDARSGHNLIFRSVRTWESDVFGFLDAYLRD